MRTNELLFNPFRRYAGFTSLFAGLVIIAATAVVSFLAGVHLDGVIDLHVGSGITFLQAMAEGFINFCAMGIILFMASLIASPTKPRFIDVFGTQALARFPFLLAVLANMLPDQDRVVKYIEYTYLKTGEPVELDPTQIALFAFATLVTLLCLVWMIILMYRAYAVSANVNGAKAVVSFIVSLIAAEVLSKVLINTWVR